METFEHKFDSHYENKWVSRYENRSYLQAYNKLNLCCESYLRAYSKLDDDEKKNTRIIII